MWFYAKQLDVLYVFFLLFKYQQRQSDTCKNTVFYCFLYETFFYIHIQNQMYRHKKQAYVQINNLIISLLLSSYNILKLKTKMYNAWTLNIAQHLVIVSFKQQICARESQDVASQSWENMSGWTTMSTSSFPVSFANPTSPSHSPPDTHEQIIKPDNKKVD